jgi:hypothetical protein
METSTLITELLKQGPLITMLGLSLYVFYRKDELRRTNDMTEREAMRTKLDAQELKIEKYLRNDSMTMQELIKKHIATSEKQTAMMGKTNEVMGCIVREIQDFKRSEIYKFHEQNKK